MAAQAPGREPVAADHQPAVAALHQGPFPGIPFAAFAAVVAIGWPGRSRPTAPGVIAFWGANEAIGQAAGPGHGQGQQVTHRQDSAALVAPLLQALPLLPGVAQQPSLEVLRQAACALVAKAAAGQGEPGANGADALQLPVATALAHQGQHGNRQAGLEPLQWLEDAAGDEVLPMAIAQHQQAIGGHGAADTIRFREFAPRPAAWPSGKAEDCKSFIPSSNLGAALGQLRPELRQKPVFPFSERKSWPSMGCVS